MGCTSPASVSKKWLHNLCLRLNRSIGSGPGIDEYINDGNASALNDVHCADVTLSQVQNATLSNASRIPLQIPFGLHGVSFFHSVPGYAANESSGSSTTTALKLSADVLARIFQRNITKWDDGAILDLNPNLYSIAPDAAGADITVIRRKFGSSSTYAMSTYLKQASSSLWKLGAGVGGDGELPTWPENTFAAANSDDMVTQLQNNAFQIGYLEAGQGRDAGLSEVAVENKDGTFLRSGDASYSQAIEEGVVLDNAVDQGIDEPSAWLNVSERLIYQSGSNTWPIVLLSQFLVDKSPAQDDGGTRALVKAFVDFALSDAGQALGRAFMFDPLPSGVRNRTRQEVDNKLMGVNKEFTLESAGEVIPGLANVSGGRFISRNMKNYARIDRALLTERIEALESGVSSFIKEDDTLNNKTYRVAVAALVLTVVQLVIIMVIGTVAFTNSRRLQWSKLSNQYPGESPPPRSLYHSDTQATNPGQRL